MDGIIVKTYERGFVHSCVLEKSHDAIIGNIIQ